MHLSQGYGRFIPKSSEKKEISSINCFDIFQCLGSLRPADTSVVWVLAPYGTEETYIS